MRTHHSRDLPALLWTALLVLPGFVGSAAAGPREKVAAAPAPAVVFSTDFECALNHPFVEEADSGTGATPNDPVHFTVTFPPGRQEAGFFLFRLDHVAGKTVRVDLITDRAGNWDTLNPVYAVIDPDRPADEQLADPALFVCRPPPQLGKDINLPQGLGGSELPITHGVFQEWQYMPRSGVDEKRKLFRVEHTFKKDEASVLVAMKVPYTPLLLDRLMADLQTRWEKEDAKSQRTTPDWAVVKVGESTEGRPLWLVRIGEAVERDPDQPPFAPPPEEKRSKRPVILFYAREHADEHDTSWVTQGVIDFLLSDHRNAKAIRKRVTVLVVPLLDPDGAVKNLYETDVIRAFEDESDRPPEAIAFAGWFREWVDAGNRLDMVFDLHNVESGEGPHLFIYMHDPTRTEESKKIHRAVAAALPGFETQGSDQTGRFSTRLGGWLRNTFGTHMMFYETNSQAPSRHLSLYEMKVMGAGILIGAVKHLVDSESFALRKELERVRDNRYGRWERYGFLGRIFDGSMDPFELEITARLASTVERSSRQQGQRVSWMNELYRKIETGELPEVPSWHK